MKQLDSRFHAALFAPAAVASALAGAVLWGMTGSASNAQTAPSAPPASAPAPAPQPMPPTPNSAPPPVPSQGTAPTMPPPSPSSRPPMPPSYPPGMMTPPSPPAAPTAAMMAPGKNVTMPAQLTVSGVAAVVNGETVTNADLVRNFLRNGAQPTLQELITRTELEQAARKAHITVTAAEIDARLRTTKEQFVQRFAGQSWSQILGSKGLSEDYARDQTRLELLVEKLAVASQPPFTLNGKIHVYHILVATSPLPYGKGGHNDADAQKQIAQIAADIKAHKITFQQAAAKYSDDSSNASKGGDLGWISQEDRLDPDFKKAAFALKEGQVSDPVKSQFGYHLIYMVQDGAHATAAQVKKAADDSLQERSRPLVSQYIQQLQASAKVQNLLIPQPPAPKPPMMFNTPPRMAPQRPVPPMPRPAPPAPGAKPPTSGAAPPAPPL